MNCADIGTKILATTQRYGKHKIPRFIYHMTCKSNYESMLNDGVIKTTSDHTCGSGIFTTELSNLFKRWKKPKVWCGTSLQEQLIEQVAKEGEAVVMIKIPTEKLNHDLLIVRSQDVLLNWVTSDSFDVVFNSVSAEVKSMPKEKFGWTDKLLKILKKHLIQSGRPYWARHITEGAPAKDSHLYKQRKEAIEYIYRGEIPISVTEKIGEVNIEELRKSAKYDPLRPMRSIFTALLKGTPEVKGAELLNC